VSLVLFWIRHGVRHSPVLLPTVGIVLLGLSWLAVLWLAATRLGYVLYVGLSLRAEDRRGVRTPEDGDAAWRRFKTRASWIMDADAAAFAALCLVTHDSIALPVARWIPVVAGAVLIVAGLAVKTWAARSLSEGAYFWRSFFVRSDRNGLSAKGPYRWLSDPMYTVGYAHAYGFALALLSAHGLLAALAAQALILGLNHVVERRHVEALARVGGERMEETSEVS
jgi:protein-S-isoprenylcysteine O-methyltransferase Ste14